MKINIKGKEFELHYSMRMYILYENILGKSIDSESTSSYTSIIALLFSAIMSSIHYYKLNISLSYDEFMDWMDSQNSTKLINDFSRWFVENITANAGLKDVVENEKKKSEKGAKQSKN